MTPLEPGRCAGPGPSFPSAGRGAGGLQI